MNQVRKAQQDIVMNEYCLTPNPTYFAHARMLTRTNTHTHVLKQKFYDATCSSVDNKHDKSCDFKTPTAKRQSPIIADLAGCFCASTGQLNLTNRHTKEKRYLMSNRSDVTVYIFYDNYSTYSSSCTIYTFRISSCVIK